MGAHNSKTASRKAGRLLSEKGVRVKKSALNILAQMIDTSCPWVAGMSHLDLASWEQIGKTLQDNNVDGLPFRIWEMILDILREGTGTEQEGERSTRIITLSDSEMSDASSAETVQETDASSAETVQETAVSSAETAETVRDSLESSSTDSEGGQTFSVDSRSPSRSLSTVAGRSQTSLCTKNVLPRSRRQRVVKQPLSAQASECTADESRSFKDNLEARLAQLIEEVKELKIQAAKQKDDRRKAGEGVYPKSRDSGQGDTNAVTHPATDRRSQTVDLQRYYQVIDVKFIKELKGAVDNYGPGSPFTQALINNVIDLELLPQEWKSLCKAVLSPGDYLLWISEWRELSKQKAMRYAHSDPEWNLDMLLGEHTFANCTHRRDFPFGALTQIAALAHRAWRILPAKGRQDTGLTNVRQGPNESFQDFVARLQDSISRSLGNSYTEGPLIAQLAFENANSVCKAILLPHKGQTDIAGYIRLCLSVGTACFQSTAMTAAVEETPAPRGLAHGHPRRRCFICGSFRHLKRDCPERAGNSTDPQASAKQRTDSQHGKGKRGSYENNSKRDVQGISHSKNLFRASPRGPFGYQKAVRGPQTLPAQEDLYLISSEPDQDM